MKREGKEDGRKDLMTLILCWFMVLKMGFHHVTKEADLVCYKMTMCYVKLHE